MTSTSATSRQFNIDAGLLSSVMVFGAVRVTEAADDPAPSVVTLLGTARDFLERTDVGGHPDFECQPTGGFGLYTGNVHLMLDSDKKPVFTGTGRKISTQATSADGCSIAPHLVNKRFTSVAGPPDACVILRDSQGVDAYEICLVDATFNEDGTSTWRYGVRELETGKDLSHWNLMLDQDHTVVAGTTPGYVVGVDGSTGFYGIKWDVDEDFSEAIFTIVLDRHYDGQTGPAGVLAKGGNQSDTGEMFVPSPEWGDSESPYPSGSQLVEDLSLGDTDAETGVADTGGIDSADSFASWFRDTPGVNLSKPLQMRLERQDDGFYVFDDTVDEDYADLGGFFPLEDEGFGNPGGSPDRNFHFTYEASAKFTYDASAGQVFKFTGDDNAWLFIDGKLALDIGGVHSAETQCVEMDRMGLEDGEEYEICFFFAERHRTQSNCRIETNIVLEIDRLPMMSAAFD